MEISNPRRILAVSLADSAQHLSDVIKDLTGTPPAPSLPQEQEQHQEQDHENEQEQNNPSPSSPEPTLAGTTHPLRLTTPYYTATVPIWLDLVSSDWSTSFLAPEAKEVLEVLGGVVLVFGVPAASSSSSFVTGAGAKGLGSLGWEEEGGGGGSSSGSASVGEGQEQGQGHGSERERVREVIRQVGRVVREGLGGWEWDGVGLAIGVGGGVGEDGEGLDEWEDLCGEWGLEFVHVPKAGAGTEGGGKRNEFGERTGVARVLEALQANDWSGAGVDEEEEEGKEKGRQGQDDDEDEDGEFDPEDLDFGFDREDFVGLRKAIWAGGNGEGSNEQDEELVDEDVQKLERMMMKLQAARDVSAGLPEEQRKKMAKRAVEEVMKEL